MFLKLKEVLWEITPECDKGCSYCGSKEIIGKKPLAGEHLLRIAEQLGRYGVDEVTITGGEPGTLAAKDPQLFSEIVTTLKDLGCKVKAVTYGKLAEVLEPAEIGKFDIIGFSINDKKDINYIEKIFSYRRDHTMITNFGKHNIWDFDVLWGCAQSFKCWQVQLTMGDQMLNADGIEHLWDKLDGCRGNIVLADNLQRCHACRAGIQYCSITYDGDVIACLSERSYGGIQKSYGNLLKKDLKDIWESEFRDLRFGSCHKCCRDFVEYPSVSEDSPNKGFILEKYLQDPEPQSTPYPQIMLYGVSSGNDVYVYGCFDSDQR